MARTTPHKTLTAALSVLATLMCALLQSTVNGAPIQHRLHLLLVGCTEYPSLPQARWLDGPENDVKLLARVLDEKRFGLTRGRQVCLAGWPAQEGRRPTRANIEREARELTRVVQPGDQVVILLAGHGSQQPSKDGDDIEPDGLDETFLPADVGNWDSDANAVRNAITDNTIGEWLGAIQQKGASVLFLADSCHSGTLTRGDLDEKERGIPAEDLVPADALERARQRVRTRGTATEDQFLSLLPVGGELVAIFAAQASETAPEKMLPDLGGQYHGLFSYTFAEILETSQTALTYRELAERIALRYRELGRTQPTPLIEGSGLDRELLGLRQWPERPTILVLGLDSSDASRLEINAGELHGLRIGSVLRAYPPAGSAEADKVIGYLRIVGLKAVNAIAEPVQREQDGTWVPSSSIAKNVFPAGSRCAIEFVNYGDLRMKVALQSQHGEGKEAQIETHRAGAGPAALENALAKIAAKPGVLADRVSEPRGADWYVRALPNGRVILAPASGWASRPQAGQTPREPTVPPGFDLGPLEAADLPDRLTASLGRIARVNCLLHLPEAALLGVTGADSADVGVELLRFAGDSDTQGAPVQYGAGGLVLHEGDKVAFRLSDPSRVPIDVTLLFVDSQYGIRALFPRGAINRLQPGETLTVYRTRVTGTTVGEERVIALAVRGEPGQPPVDFSLLEQPALEKIKETGTRGERGSLSPLAALLNSALEGGGAMKSRDLGAPEVASYAVRLVSWTTVPK